MAFKDKISRIINKRILISWTLVISLLMSTLLIGFSVSADVTQEQQYSFETGSGTDYVHSVINSTWGVEQKCSYTISKDQAAEGEQSLLFTTTTGADKSQYMRFKGDVFVPERAKWMNVKVFVPEDSDTEIVRLFGRVGSSYKTSEPYYFVDNPTSPVTTDAIRVKGEWVTLSYQLPDDTMSVIGMLFEIHDKNGNNSNCKIYIDSLSLTDAPLDKIRYFDKEDTESVYSFEAGVATDYVHSVINFNWGVEQKCSYTISKDQAAAGEQSLLFTTTTGANKGQYLRFQKDVFVAEKNKWMNVKVFVPEDSGTEIVRLFGMVGGSYKVSEPYYFADNPTTPVTTDAIRAKGEWVTLSYQLPDDDVTTLGLRFEIHDSNGSNSNCKIYIDSFSLTDTPLDKIRYFDKEDTESVYSFEAGMATDYVHSVINSTWGVEQKCSYTISKDQAAEGEQSLLFTTTTGADKSQFMRFKSDVFVPERAKWMNVKVFVPEDSGTEIVRLFGRVGSDYKTSEPYYFVDNPTSPVTTDAIRAKGEWVTLSYQLPDDNVTTLGLRFDIHDSNGSNSNCKIYIDSFSLTDYPADGIRYFDKNNTEMNYSFEAGKGTDYVHSVINSTWGVEQKCSYTISKDQAAEGEQSLLFTTTTGADKSQYMRFKGDVFVPERAKWMNVKVFVPEDSDTEIVRLFGRVGSSYKTSEPYYFVDNPTSPVTTDAIRAKGEWVTLSYQLPDDTMSVIGMLFEIHDKNGNNSNCKIYIDSLSLTDAPLDEIRYVTETQIVQRHSFEIGEASQYVDDVINLDGEKEDKCSYTLSKEQAEDGQQSLFFTTTTGANRGQYMYLNSDAFVPQKGMWMNIKVFVPNDSGTEIIQLFSKVGSDLKESEPYYFSDNPTAPVTTDAIRQKGKWVTLSYQLPDVENLSILGIKFSIHDENGSNSNCKVYIDSFSIGDSPLDGIRYFDTSDKKVIKSFESGSAKDYVSAIKTNSLEEETKASCSITNTMAADGQRALLFTTTTGAAKGQYVHFFNNVFKIQPLQWINFKVLVPEDSDTEIIRLFCETKDGKIMKGAPYYFANKADNSINAEKISKKGEWVTISYQLPGVEINDCGIFFDVHDTSETASNDNCVVYIDSFDATTAALDTNVGFWPEVELPTNYAPGGNEIKTSQGALLQGITLTTSDKVKTNIGELQANKIVFNCEEITKGNIYDAVSKSIPNNNAFSLFSFSMTNKGTEIKLNEKITIQMTIPSTIDIKEPKVAFVDTSGKITLLDSKVSFENIIFDIDKLGNYVLFGAKAPKVSILVDTVIVKNDDNNDEVVNDDSNDGQIDDTEYYAENTDTYTETDSNEETTTEKVYVKKKVYKDKPATNNNISVIIAIIVGAVVLLAGGLITTIVLIKKKKRRID